MRPSATVRNSSSIGSIRLEWKAWLTDSRVVLRSRHWASSSSIRSAGPAMTTACGPLTAARSSAVREFQLVLGGLDGEHRAAVGQRAHQAAAGADQRGRIGEREHARDVRGGDLADRVPDHDVRSDPDRLQQAVERDLEREQRRLRVLGPVKPVAGEHPFFQPGRQVLQDLVQGLCEAGYV